MSRHMIKRTSVPSGRAEAILFDSDMSCCICRVRRDTVQLHHLDGNSNNHDSRNLAVLCLNHHSQATASPGLGRGLNAGVIRRYRDEWLTIVRGRRRLRAQKGIATKDYATLHGVCLQALACHEVRKIRHDLQNAEWSKCLAMMEPLYAFTDWSYGQEVRSEILYTLTLLTDRTRDDMPVAVANGIENLVRASLPIGSLVHRSPRRVDAKTRELLRSAVHIGFAIAYDGIKYLGNIGVIAGGTRILFITLRYAHVNMLSKLKTAVLKEFRRLADEATRAKSSDAGKWIEFERLDALALDGDPLPPYPRDIAARISAAEP